MATESTESTESTEEHGKIRTKIHCHGITEGSELNAWGFAQLWMYLAILANFMPNMYVY